MSYEGHIQSDPAILHGKPSIKGTRIAVELILRKLAEGMSVSELLAAYPGLSEESVQACLSYSAAVISQEEIIAG